jgi:LPS export ABC transporter protein LptC
MRRSDAARALAAVALAAAASACHIDYGAALEGAASGESLPTARFVDYVHTVVVRGQRSFELKAAKADIYDLEKKALLSSVDFAEYDPDTGELVSRGHADEAVLDTETEDAEFSGSVRLESKKQDALLEGEYLRWDNAAKKLEGRLDRSVTVSRGDGSWMSGAGFQADARHRSFSFRESVEGRVADTAKDEKAAPPAGSVAPPASSVAPPARNAAP